MNFKTILSLGTLAATGFFVFGKDKYSEYKNVLDSLQMEIKEIKNLKLGSQVTFNVDVMVTNPTPTAINIPGNQLIIKDLHFYTLSGKKLGLANLNLADISFPANNYRLITNIPVSLSLNQIGSNISELLEIVGDKDKLKIAADIEAFGKQFTINA